MKVDKLIKRVENGDTLYIATYGRIIKIDKKVLNRFRKAGCDVLRPSDDAGFYVARGKHFDYIAPGGCRVWLERG